MRVWGHGRTVSSPLGELRGSPHTTPPEHALPSLPLVAGVIVGVTGRGGFVAVGRPRQGAPTRGGTTGTAGPSWTRGREGGVDTRLPSVVGAPCVTGLRGHTGYPTPLRTSSLRLPPPPRPVPSPSVSLGPPPSKDLQLEIKKPNPVTHNRP